MYIELSKEQFRLLLDLVFAGNWVINATKLEGEIDEKYETIQSHIFSYCENNGLMDLIEYDPFKKMYKPSSKFESTGIGDKIVEYFQYSVLEALSARLAERDADIRYPEDEKLKYEFIEMRIKQYMKEFELNEVKHIRVLKSKEKV